MPFLETGRPMWDKLIAINLTGALNMHHAVLPGMLARKRGRIVNVASDAARVGSSGEAVYAACKAGLVGFSKTLAREHAPPTASPSTSSAPAPTDTNLFAEYKKGPRNPEKLDEAFRAPYRWAASASPKTARRHLLLRQRRRRLHHRTGASACRRPDDGRMNRRKDPMNYEDILLRRQGRRRRHHHQPSGR